MIRLQTSVGRDIPNEQRPEFDPESGLIEESRVRQNHKRVEVRTASSGIYNCHGLTFASRRARIPDAISISVILEDDKYAEVRNPAEVLPGDVVLYLDNCGDAVHSGVVVERREAARLLILSKWGYGPEVIHDVTDVPSNYRNARTLFYRCRL